MQASVFHAAGDIRIETVPDPAIVEPTDAIVRITRATICGSDLWSYRGVTTWEPGWRTGHEFVGVVDAVGDAVRSVKPGDAVITPFAYSDGTCEFCRRGLQTSCLQGGGFGASSGMGGQAQAARVPQADGTLVVMPPEVATDPRLLSWAALLTDVVPTGHHAAVCARVRPGSTAIVIGDGAVGLCAVLAASRLGAERILAVGHHPDRLEIARRFGATEVVDSHDAEVVQKLVESTKGGAACVLEAVGSQASMDMSFAVARPGGTVGFVGVPHQVGQVNLKQLMFNNVGLNGGIAPARAYIEPLLQELLVGRRDPTAVLDLTVPLSGVPEGFRAMNERRAIKVLIEVG
ncbi:MAG: zinc-dependent alcohol dehydrogenase family protein [Candidatus Dormibacteria bacterium]